MSFPRFCCYTVSTSLPHTARCLIVPTARVTIGGAAGEIKCFVTRAPGALAVTYSHTANSFPPMNRSDAVFTWSPQFNLGPGVGRTRIFPEVYQDGKRISSIHDELPSALGDSGRNAIGAMPIDDKTARRNRLSCPATASDDCTHGVVMVRIARGIAKKVQRDGPNSHCRRQPKPGEKPS